jgi:hypothetical protein
MTYDIADFPKHIRGKVFNDYDKTKAKEIKQHGHGRKC